MDTRGTRRTRDRVAEEDQARRDDLDATIRELREDLARREAEIAAHTASATSNEAALQAYRTQVATMRRSIDDLQRQLQQGPGRFARLFYMQTDQLNLYRRQFADLRRQLAQMADEMQALRQQPPQQRDQPMTEAELQLAARMISGDEEISADEFLARLDALRS